MCIYINSASPINIGDENLIDYLKSKGIEPYVDRNLKDVEEKCCMSLINLSMFDSLNVNLKCGIDIGFSDAVDLLTFAIIDSNNSNLKNELSKLNVRVFNKDLLEIFLNDAKIFKRIQELKSVLGQESKLDERKKCRQLISLVLNETIEEIRTRKEKKINTKSVDSMLKDVARK
jgi:hypothetical protein